MKKKNNNIIILGASGVGKTAIAMGFVKDIFDQKYDPTIEDLYLKEYKINGKQKIMLTITDTAGSVTYPYFNYFISVLVY
jgi:GTPase SAR1 family protein